MNRTLHDQVEVYKIISLVLKNVFQHLKRNSAFPYGHVISSVYVSCQVDMPVFFYIDPEFTEDPAMAKVETITLSYTFFEAKEAEKLGI